MEPIENAIEQVSDFVTDELGVKKEKLTASTRFVEDLGVVGDDAPDLLNAFARKFDVDMSLFPYSEYFPPEAVFLFSFSKRNLSILTIHDLAQVLLRRRW